MERNLNAGRGLALVGVMFVLLGGAVLAGFGAPTDPPLEHLVTLARTDLQERLDVRAEAIALESIEPSTFPCPSPSDCQERLPGYVIRLKADDVVYEYQGKVSERLSVIWHEVTEASVR